MTKESLDPKRTCLLFFDCTNVFVNGSSLDPAGRSPDVAAAVSNWERQLALARELDMMVAYACAVNREDRADAYDRLTDIDFRGNPVPSGERLQGTGLAYGSQAVQVIDDIAPRPDDYVFWKRRWSPFFQTHFELSLRARGVETIIVNGGSIEVGLAATAYAMQTLDFDMVIVPDGCTSNRANCREAFMTVVFPLIGRVRSTNQIGRAHV